MLVTEIEEAPPLIEGDLGVILVGGRFEEVAERIESFAIDPPARQAHAQERHDQVLIEGLVRARAVKLETEL